MSDQFTKEEAVEILGKPYLCIEDLVKDGHEDPSVEMKSGDVGVIRSVHIWDDPGVIKVCLDVYGNFHSVDKQQFLKHFQLLEPVPFSI